MNVRNDYEREEALYDITALITPHISEMPGCDGIITKIPIYAVERIKAVQKAGFMKPDHSLTGKTGYAYDGYWKMK